MPHHTHPAPLNLNYWQGLMMHLNKTKINLLKIESILRLGQQPFAILLPLISTFNKQSCCVNEYLRFFFTQGCRKYSLNNDKFSTAVPFPEVISLIGLFGLWVLIQPSFLPGLGLTLRIQLRRGCVISPIPAHYQPNL